MNYLDALANLASIITAAVAAYGYGSYRWLLCQRQTALERVLENKKEPNDDSLTLSQLATELTLTEAQVIKAAHKSKKVQSFGGQSGNEYQFRFIKKSN